MSGEPPEKVANLLVSGKINDMGGIPLGGDVETHSPFHMFETREMMSS